MQDESLLHYYEALEVASSEMLTAAQSGDWDRVLRIETDCGRLIAELKRASHHRALTAEEERRKLRIMRRILRHDAQIRELAEPWIESLAMSLSDFPRVLH